MTSYLNTLPVWARQLLKNHIKSTSEDKILHAKKIEMRMAISRDSIFDPVKFLILIYPSKIVSSSNWAKQRYKCFKIVFNKIVSLGEILARLKWVSMIGDRTFPRIYCARNDAAKGPRNASLCECSLDSRTLCSYYHAGLYSAQWSPSRTEFSTVLLSYDIPCPYHILVYSPSFLSHFIFVTRRIFTGRKKKYFYRIRSRNRYYEYTFIVSSIV